MYRNNVPGGLYMPENIHTLIRYYNLPLNSNYKPYYAFIKDHLKDYRNALSNCNEVHDNPIFSEVLPIVTKTCILLNDILTKLENNHDACSQFNELMNLLSPFLTIKNITQTSTTKYYRIQELKSDDRITRERLFHPPFERFSSKNLYRYSTSTAPTLYLSSKVALCWFESSVPDSFYISEFHFDPKKSETLSLIDFSRRPEMVALDWNDWNQFKPDWLPPQEEHVIKYLITYPLRSACSVIKNESCAEYQLPNLLMTYIVNTSNYNGIAYQTSSNYKGARVWNAFNIALPAKNIKSSGYCTQLASYFKISIPSQMKVPSILQEYNETTSKIRSYLKELEYREVSTGLTFAEKQYQNYCSGFINLFDSYRNIANDNPNSNLPHNMFKTGLIMDLFLTMPLQSDFFIKIEDSLHKLSLDEIKLLHKIAPENQDEYINFAIEKYRTEVQPLFIDYYGFDSKFEILLNSLLRSHGDNSFDYITT